MRVHVVDRRACSPFAINSRNSQTGTWLIVPDAMKIFSPFNARRNARAASRGGRSNVGCEARQGGGELAWRIPQEAGTDASPLGEIVEEEAGIRTPPPLAVSARRYVSASGWLRSATAR